MIIPEVTTYAIAWKAEDEFSCRNRAEILAKMKKAQHHVPPYEGRMAHAQRSSIISPVSHARRASVVFTNALPIPPVLCS
jgi:hypothetical protein